MKAIINSTILSRNPLKVTACIFFRNNPFNNEKVVRTFYNSEDVLDGEGNISGTEVTLHIKYKNDVHESVSYSI